jgi:hypothetical protein
MARLGIWFWTPRKRRRDCIETLARQSSGAVLPQPCPRTCPQLSSGSILEIIRIGSVYGNRGFHTNFHMIRLICILEIFLYMNAFGYVDKFRTIHPNRRRAFGNVFPYTNEHIIIYLFIYLFI